MAIKKEKTVKVRMLVSMASHDSSWVPGDIQEVRPDIAEAWKEANIAELVEGDK